MSVQVTSHSSSIPTLTRKVYKRKAPSAKINIEISEAMAFLNVQTILCSVVSLVLWRIIRSFVVKTQLSGIPGPPAESWWKGTPDLVVVVLHKLRSFYRQFPSSL